MYPRAAVSRVMPGLAKALVLASVGVVPGGCAGRQSVLDPRGTEAGDIAGLWWLLLAIAGVVFAIVMGLLFYAAFHRSRTALAGRSPEDETDRRATRWIVLGGAAIPAVILAGVFVVTLGTLAAITPGQREPDLVVEIVGAQWWWEVRYFPDDPRQRVTLANELHLPVGRTVELRLGARDVIHSFWVPGLQGKVDMIPGRTNRLSFRPEETAVLRGQCAEFCGLQHAWMALTVVTESDDDFERWLDGQREAATIPPLVVALTPGSMPGGGAPPAPVTTPPPSANAAASPATAEQMAGAIGQGSQPASPDATAPGVSVGAAGQGDRPLVPGTARSPTAESVALGYRTFFTAGCNVCHTLRGTPAGGLAGPDLTHVATRLTLAGGMLDNTRGHLAGWVSNPQQIKPGTLMPNVALEAAEFQALLDYLQSLE